MTMHTPWVYFACFRSRFYLIRLFCNCNAHLWYTVCAHTKTHTQIAVLISFLFFFWFLSLFCDSLAQMLFSYYTYSFVQWTFSDAFIFVLNLYPDPWWVCTQIRQNVKERRKKNLQFVNCIGFNIDYS